MKFQDPHITAKGEERAYVDLKELRTLWINSGTQCNLACKNCYIESSPTNDRLAFFKLKDARALVEEIKDLREPTELIGITGGEPFLNPEIIPISEAILSQGFELLILTNANRVWRRHQSELLDLKERFADKLHIRISLDHYSQEGHDGERGAGNFERAMFGIEWFAKNQFNVSIAGRSLKTETLSEAREGYAELFAQRGFAIDTQEKLVIFPEMDLAREVPEITTACWGILDKKPSDQMCATERMVVLRRGESKPQVLPCTLLAYDPQFELGHDLKSSHKRVFLNHKFCAQFCVLGGASCSSTK